MMMIGAGEHDGVDAGLSEEVVIVEVSFDAFRRFFLSGLEIRLINVAESDTLRSHGLKVPVQITAASTRCDDAIGDAVVGAEGAAGNKQRYGRECSGLKEIAAEEIAAVRFHIGKSPCVLILSPPPGSSGQEPGQDLRQVNTQAGGKLMNTHLVVTLWK